MMSGICDCFKEKEIINNDAIPILKSKNYDYVKALGSGVFGEVVICKNKSIGKMVAVKIVPSRNFRKLESEIWGKLLHPNIIPMMDYMKFENFEIFIMPLEMQTLYDCMKKSSFRKKSYGFQMTTRWLRDVLCGIDYLHKIQVCHLDVKVDNVLISNNMTALLSDFSCVNTTVDKVVGYGLIPCCRPPETCPYTGEWKTNGVPFDIWSYGILCLHVFAFEWMEHHLDEEEIYWQRNVYPWLFEALQLPIFGKLLNTTFPKVSQISKEVELALNLVKSTLRYHSWDRPKTKVLLRHALLSKDPERIILEPDDIWKVDHNDKGLFTTLDAERPSTMPRRIREIKRRKSLQALKVAENLKVKSCISLDENKNNENVIGDNDSSSRKCDFTGKEVPSNKVRSCLIGVNVDQTNEDPKAQAGYGGDFRSNTEEVDRDRIMDKNEQDFINAIKEKAKVIKSQTEFENLVLKHSSASFDCVRVLREKRNIRPYMSDTDISKVVLDKDLSFHSKTKENFVYKDLSAMRLDLRCSRSLDTLQTIHENMFSKTSWSDSVILNKSFIKDYEARTKSSQGFKSISGKSLVDSVTQEESSESLIQKFDKQKEYHSRLTLIQNKSRSSCSFPEEREKCVKLSASASATIPESCIDGHQRNICTLRDIVRSRRVKKSIFRRVGEWFSHKWEKYRCCSCFSTTRN